MAWPGYNNNNFWEGIYNPNHPPPPPAHGGAGVDHAPPPPPPPGLPPIINPEFWTRWAQRRGWEDFMGPTEGPWGPRPDEPHGHGHGPGPGPRHGRRGRHEGRDSSGEGHAEPGGSGDEAPEYITDDEVAAATAAAAAEKKEDGSPDTTMRDETADPPEEVPNPEEGGQPRRRGGRRDRGSCGRRCGPRGSHHGGPPPQGPFGPWGPFGGGMFGGGPRRRSSGHRGPPGPPPFPPMFEGLFGGPRGPPHGHGHGPRGPPPPPPGPGGAFDLRGLMDALANYPHAQHVREYLERALNGRNNAGHEDRGDSSGDDDMDASFTPPLDFFEHMDKWVLHLAVPGAKKEDIGVNWDADRSVLSIGGVIHRPGDEEFLRGLVSGERRTGLFRREVRLPPADSNSAEGKEEVNSEGISATMENGVLIVTVPKLEKERAEVKRVEIK